MESSKAAIPDCRHGQKPAGAGAWPPAIREMMRAILVLVWLALVALLGLSAVRRKTVTIDEFHHLPAGCLTLRTGEFYMHPKTPPLARCWHALGCWSDDPNVPLDPRWRELAPGWGPWMYGTAFFLRNRDRYDRLFFGARIANTIWLAPLGLALFGWAQYLYGLPGAVLALFLLGLSPSFLAHAPLATTDLAAAATFFAASFFFWRSGLQERSWAYPLAAGLLLGAGLLAKFTLILLPIAWLAVLALHWARERLTRAQRCGVGSLWARTAARDVLRCMGRRCVFPVAVALVVVNAGYGFKGTFSTSREIGCHSRLLRSVGQSWLGQIPLPVPRDFLLGLDAQRADSELGEFPSYLLGRWSPNGWWSYYLVVLLVKTPTALLVLLCLTLLPPWSHQGGALDAWTSLCVWVPVVLVVFVLSFLNRLDLGIRYLLPILPFLYLHIGRVTRLVAGSWRWLTCVAGCLLWYAVSSLSAYPHHLSYFTEMVGGVRRGHQYLLDSNIDWGQDLHCLRDYMDAHGIERIKLAYFGHVPPEHYGIRYDLLGPQPQEGYIAASVSYVCGQRYATTYVDGEVTPVAQDAYRWLRGYTPVGRAGKSIWIYHIERNDAQTATPEQATWPRAP